MTDPALKPGIIETTNEHRANGRRRIVDKAQAKLQSFFDELKNGTTDYGTVANLRKQVTQEYRGRCVVELLQNAHDVLGETESDEARQVLFKLTTTPEPILVVANGGRPFRVEDFEGICQLGQSPKDPNKSVGNKGLGFWSVLEVTTSPEIWSTTAPGEDAAFAFRFNPSVGSQVAECALALHSSGLEVRSPFDRSQPLVDWTDVHLHKYRTKTADNKLEVAKQARDSLSPYGLPLTFGQTDAEVTQLAADGFVTVIRLPLDGGLNGSANDAVESVRGQLETLEAMSTVFLKHLERLIIEIDGKRRILERVVDSDTEFRTDERTRQQVLLVGRSCSVLEETTSRQFRVWNRTVGGPGDTTGAQRIKKAVNHLPNRWPEVCRVTVGVAVEETRRATPGVFVIFLPTETRTGTATHINAPFYGSLNRRSIDFRDPYNGLLLDEVLHLCLDIIRELAAGPPEEWRASAIIDLIASIGTVGNTEWRIIELLSQRAEGRNQAMGQQSIILCDNGWQPPSAARLMPEVSDHASLTRDVWREHAGFEVIADGLRSRFEVVRRLLHDLGGSPDPTASEWGATLERLASEVQKGAVEGSWNDFLGFVEEVHSRHLKSPQRHGQPDPLMTVRFLPTQDGRILSKIDAAKLFFQPVRGANDAAELVGDVPTSVKERVAFLHPDVETQEGAQRRNTAVQKFLDGRFARGFRREDLLRDVVVAALPRLPASYDTEEAGLCAELFSWSMKLIGNGEHATLVPLLRRLPVACHGGWYPMDRAVFGPGWEGRRGDLLRDLTDQLPDDARARILETALLPPTDKRWGRPVADRLDLFDRAGVVDGFRLKPAPNITFEMEGYGRHELPSAPPGGTPEAAWDSWREAARNDVKPRYEGSHSYTLSGVSLLPEIHYLSKLNQDGRDAFSRLLLASFRNWEKGWERTTLSKLRGNRWSRQLQSPLHYWLSTIPWLHDRGDVQEPLANRWLVPDSLLAGQEDRFAHLDPISQQLTRRLVAEPELKTVLRDLGLNLYPFEEQQVGPELLDALANAWVSGRVPPQRFEVFLGQLRDAWRHLDPEIGLPRKYVVRTRQRSFTVQKGGALEDVYLPDNSRRTRSLREHGKHVLEMHVADANRLREQLVPTTGLRPASALEERVLVDGRLWQGQVDVAAPLDETRYAWLPPVLLTVMAHGGSRPTGTSTKAWNNASEVLRRAHLLECETIAVHLVADETVVASSEPHAQWLDSGVLAIRRDMELLHERLASATQSILGRQDLLKDLRLVLGALNGHEEPTPEQIESALERADIDVQALADVRHFWAGKVSLLIDRIRPVLAVLGVKAEGLDAAATDVDHLTSWLTANQEAWPVQDLLATARRRRDDHAMGMAAWRKLGSLAELPAWNKALKDLGELYEPVENRQAAQQLEAHLDEAQPYLRALAREVALASDDPRIFHAIEKATRDVHVSEDWPTRFWEVPFAAVIDALKTEYDRRGLIDAVPDFLPCVHSVEELRATLTEKKIGVEPDPYKVAGENRDALECELQRVTDIYRAWLESKDASTPSPAQPKISADLEAAAYLKKWTKAELLERAIAHIGDGDFAATCAGCQTAEQIRSKLDLDEKVVEERRRERQREKQKAERMRRTFHVAGDEFEVGVTSYAELLKRLSPGRTPEGPAASKDEFTELANAQPGGGRGPRKPPNPGKTSHRRPTAELRELVGVVGEIHAFWFLQREFGSDVVTWDAWLSEIRLRVRRLVPGEIDKTSDGHGFDFRFRCKEKKLWHIEVKATTGSDPTFDLGISEIEAASRIARKPRSVWRILRIGNALTENPEFEWLPNPFEEGCRKYFRFQKTGMRVSYFRKKT